jgi:hypothetical protein
LVGLVLDFLVGIAHRPMRATEEIDRRRSESKLRDMVVGTAEIDDRIASLAESAIVRA